MFGNFIAQGTVMAKEVKTAKNGNPYATSLLKVGEYQGQPELLQFTLAGKSFSQANLFNQGDEIAISGFVRSKQNDRGYWNTDVRVNGVVTLRKAQQDQGYQGQMNAYADQQPDPYANADIPFDGGRTYGI